MAVIPARPRRPKDKGCVENGVLLTERRILAVLRHRQFESLGEANKAIWELLDQINHKPFQKMPGSRASLLEELDRAALRALPTQPYEYCEWRKAKVNIDYHVVVDSPYYSVPYKLVGKTMQVRLTANCVELFDRGQRVAAHVRRPGQGSLDNAARAASQVTPRALEVVAGAHQTVGTHDWALYWSTDQRPA